MYKQRHLSIKKDIDRLSRMDSPYYTVKEIAKHLKISMRTVYRAIEKGHIVAFRIQGGRYRILKSEVNRLLKENHGPINPN